MKLSKSIIALLIVLITGSGCVYFNTFYYASKNFKDAESLRQKTGGEKAGSAAGKYRTAIEKALTVITEHPDSKYVDDALYIIGKSYYHLEDYNKAERKFRELLAAYPKSKYAEASLFYLGRCRLERQDFILARQSFARVDSTTTNKKWKAEAQYMIGEIEFSEGKYDTAITYYTKYLNDYGDAENAAIVQYKVGDAFILQEDYESAKNAYLAVAKYAPSDSLYFESQFKAGEAYYSLNMIDSGYAVFEALVKNEKYYDRAGQIRLKLAEAQFKRGNMEAAIEEYSRITSEFERTDAAARAYYQIGEIYMRDFGDLETAKRMYDSAQSAYRRSDIYQSALERSVNIGKLSKYREAASAEDLDTAAFSQYNLAEVFLFELENPDTALLEFQNVIDSFPNTKFAAKAYLALGYIYQNYKDEPDLATEAYMKVITDYSSTDFVEDAAAALKIDLDTMNIDYPGARYRSAEKLLFDKGNIDSAMVVFQSVIDDFPESRYAPQAAYAKAWLTEKYAPIVEYNPGDSTSIPDSTIIFAYQNVADTYGGTLYGDSAMTKLGKKVSKRAPAPAPPTPTPAEEEPDVQDETSGTINNGSPQQEFRSDADTYEPGTPQYIDSLIDTLHVVDAAPVNQPEFVYPPEAYSSKFEGYVSFKVKIDFLGRPSEWKILQSSYNKDIDEAAVENLRYTEFNVGEIPVEYIDQWQFYRIKVELPLEIKGRQ